MKDKYYDFTGSLIMGIIFITLGIMLLIGKKQLYHDIIMIIVFVLWGNAFIQMLRLFFRKQEKSQRKRALYSCLFHLIICLIFAILPEFILGIAPIFFAIYLILIGLSQYVMCYLEIKSGENFGVRYFLLGSIYLGISLPIFIAPITKLDTFLICLSIYILFLGISFLWDSLIQILPIRTKNHLKRKIRITLPKIIEVMLPYSVMVEINHNLEVSHPNQYSYGNKLEKSVDLNILIHTSNRGVNKMGHIDICFDGKVISYGNYDEGSRFCKEFFGDGVLFTANRKEDYINFCIDNSKKTIFDFGIHLTEKQKIRVQKRIDELLDNTVPWDHKEDKKYNSGNSYAGRLYKKTKATFYKFAFGKYKTYFVLGTNCCFLADDIIGKSGTDILSLNGIITPGTYYDYLNRKLKVRNSNVIYKEIYNRDRRPK